MTSITFDNLSRADGSALVDQENTIVQAAVFGPVDIPQSRVDLGAAVIEISFKPKVSISSSNAAFDRIREIESILKGVFEEIILTKMHPRTAISILVQEIHESGHILSASINAAYCALIDAGIPMRCPVVGISSRHTDDKGVRLQFVFDNKLELITLITRGCIDEEELLDAIEDGKDKAKKHFDIVRTQMKGRFLN